VQKTLQGRVEVAGVSQIHKTLHPLKREALLFSKMETLYPKFSEVIHKYKNHPNVEIEFRLGKVNRGSFDTNVGFDIFCQIKNSLDLYKGWEACTHSEDQVFYGENGRRAVTDAQTDETVRIIKTKVAKVDHICEGRPFDIRLGIATEVPQEGDDDDVYDKVKQRRRFSYTRKNLRIDLTCVKGPPDDPDSETDTQYQVELEIIDPKLVTDDRVLYPLVNKVFDLLNVL
jgi:hypothetical protein